MATLIFVTAVLGVAALRADGVLFVGRERAVRIPPAPSLRPLPPACG
jgi:hypothetical protein